MTGRGEAWHLDKKVPLGIIIAIVIQTITLVMIGTAWKTETDNRLEALEKTDLGRASLNDRVIVLEQKFSYIQGALDRIEKNIERITP
jgi:septation ring formation regulator EzrA